MLVEKSHDFKSPIFIGGLMKSGTSLLRVLLGQHPDIFASFETHWFSEDFQNHWHNPERKRVKYLLQFYGISQKSFYELCQKKSLQPERQFIDIVFETMCQKFGKKRWVEKTPDNIKYWSLIQEEWPDAKLIHVTREYRDCFASWKARRGDTIDRFLNSFPAVYEDIYYTLGKQSNNYFEVDYYELVSDPSQAMTKILNFLKLELSPNCFKIDTSQTATERLIVQKVTGRDSKTSISLEKPIFRHSLGQWKNILTDTESALIQSELMEYYNIFGSRWLYGSQ